MKISYRWLKDFLHTEKDVEELGRILTDIGLEVEKIYDYQPVKTDLKGVVVGKVLEVKKHPAADRLSVTKVDIGAGEPLQIVCGAPNVAEGQKVPVATIGTKLVTFNGEEIKLKKGKLRGVESYGMILAEDEIGLSPDHEGIMVLDDKVEVGKTLDEVLDIQNDKVFEIGLTPNRADAMSHFGVARDLHVKLEFEGQPNKFSQRSVGKFIAENRVQPVRVEIEEPEKCPRYMGLVIQNVKVKPSPEWLQERLKAIGLVPRNNIVDITNYVLHDLGQPMHAFDLRKIKGNEIIVRAAQPGEKIVALDDKEYELSPEDLVIANKEEVMAIAGVMGGKESAISDDTTDILLESAYFEPVSVRKTAKKLGLSTDSSFRFERGVDPGITDTALKWAALLIKETDPDAIITEPVEETGKKLSPVTINLTYDYLNKMIGEEIPQEKIKEILSLLEFQIISANEENLTVVPPLYRVDVTRPADVVEDILRIYGYNTVPLPEKMIFSVAHEEPVNNFVLENAVSSLLKAQGYTETMSVSLTSDAKRTYLPDFSADENVELINPVSRDFASLRQSLLVSGLENIRYNLNRRREDLAFFEFGKTYFKRNGEYVEEKHLALFLTGVLNDENWLEKSRKSNFFHLKGTVEKIPERTGLETVQKPVEHPAFSEAVGLYLKSNKSPLIILGKVKPSVTAKFEIKKPVFYADIDWNLLLDAVRKNTGKKIKPIPKFPSVRRDLSLILDKSVTYAELYRLAFDTEKKLLREMNLFDVYEGDKIEEGKKSYAISFILRSDDKTLKDKQIDKVMSRIVDVFRKKTGAVLRDK